MNSDELFKTRLKITGTAADGEWVRLSDAYMAIGYARKEGARAALTEAAQVARDRADGWFTELGNEIASAIEILGDNQ